MRTEPIGKTPGCLYDDPGNKRIVFDGCAGPEKAPGACMAGRIAEKATWPAGKCYWLISAFIAGT